MRHAANVLMLNLFGLLIVENDLQQPAPVVDSSHGVFYSRLKTFRLPFPSAEFTKDYWSYMERQRH